jgi:hypothetical protein
VGADVIRLTIETQSGYGVVEMRAKTSATITHGRAPLQLSMADSLEVWRKVDELIRAIADAEARSA